jgi:hypothetical protein
MADWGESLGSHATGSNIRGLQRTVYASFILTVALTTAITVMKITLVQDVRASRLVGRAGLP